MKTTRIASLFIILSAIFVSTGCAVETDDTEIGSSTNYATANDAPGWFELFKGKDGQYYFRLKSANHEIVLASEGYKAKASAENGIASVENNGVDITNYQLKQASNGQWYFTLRAGNYQVIGSSETYTTKSNAEIGAEGVQDLLIRVLRHDARVNGGAAFELLDGNDGQIYFHLEAANREIILQSEGYTARHNALNGIEAVRDYGKDLGNFEVLEATNGQFYFNLVAANGEIVGTSELYVSASNAQTGAETVNELLVSERVADAE